MLIRNIFKFVIIFLLGVSGGIFADQILWPYFIERPLLYKYRLEQNPIYVTEVREITIQENAALKNAIEKVEKTVIGLKTKTKAGKMLEGSGLILTSDGLIVTLADLVPQGSTFSFFVEGKSTPYQILKRDLEENLALVKIEATNLPIVSFADFQKLKLGERVFLVGAIFEEGIFKKSVNEGMVKSFDEDKITTNIVEESNLAGSSLFDIDGNFLGLNTINSEGEIITIPVSKIKTFSGF